MESGLFEDDSRVSIRWSGRRTGEERREVQRPDENNRHESSIGNGRDSEDAEKTTRPAWKDCPEMELSVTKPWKYEWLAQNLDNPFRGWDGAEHTPAASAKKSAD